MKILLAVDGSPYALHAARFLRRHLDPARVEVLDLATVPELPPTLDTDGQGTIQPISGEGSPDSARSPLELARSWMEDALAEFSTFPAAVSGRVLEGNPGERILALLDEDGYDVVVLGVKGRGAAPFFELGSTARTLLDHSQVPLLLVRPDPRDEAGEGLRAVLPIDGGRGTLEEPWSLLSGFRLAPRSLEIFALLGGSDPVTRMESPAEGWSGGSRSERKAEARRWLSTTLPSLIPEDRLGTTSVLAGRAGSQLEEHLRQSGSHLLALSMPPAGRPGRRIAQELVWSAPCSVLVTRRQTSPEPGRQSDGLGPVAAAV